MSVESKEVRVILNGDDFGLGSEINRGIISAIQGGILTSTSVMVKRSAAEEIDQLLDYPDISIGLHLDMTEGGTQIGRDLLRLFATSPKQIERDFYSQVDTFTELTGRRPDHIDGHHHIHQLPILRPYVLEYSLQHNIPLRSRNGPVKLVSSLLLQSLLPWNKVGPAGLIDIMKKLKPGTYEIVCHPGYDDGLSVEGGTTYLSRRTLETQTLMSPEVEEFVRNQDNISLISWRDV